MPRGTWLWPKSLCCFFSPKPRHTGVEGGIVFETEYFFAARRPDVSARKLLETRVVRSDVPTGELLKRRSIENVSRQPSVARVPDPARRQRFSVANKMED